MKRVISFLKRYWSSRILSMLLIGVLMLASTACSGARAAVGKADGGTSSDPLARRHYESKVLDEPSDSEGGINTRRDQAPSSLAGPGKMYPFSDTDPRRDTRAAESRAKALVENAERKNEMLFQDRLDERRGEDFERLGQKVQQAPSEIGEQAKRNLNELREETQERSATLKDNVGTAARDVPALVKDTAARAKENVQGAAENLVEGAQQVGENAQQAGQDLARNTQQSARGMVD